MTWWERQLTYEQLVPVIRQCTGVRVSAEQLAESDTGFEELGVDSLGLLGVVAELERRYSLTLGAEAEQATSPVELVAVVNRELEKGA